ncbi:MAG: HAD family hydrolase [Caldilineaceae bacterium]|nr:HAD family hydrolase [Caldilineaceae bacterium]
MLSIIAVDLDDTIVRSDGVIAQRTIDALLAWEAGGGRVVIATGRPPRSTRKITERLHHLPWICYNGAIILQGDAILHEDYIPGAVTTRIVQMLQDVDPTLRIGLEIDDVLYINQPLKRYDCVLTEDLLSVANQPTAKVILTLDHYEQVAPRLAELPTSVRALLSPKYNLVQIMTHTTSKAAALAHLVDLWGESLANVIAFGDDTNDVEMLEECGVGVAMANAVPEVFAVADRVTASNDEDGVAIVIEELLEMVVE